MPSGIPRNRAAVAVAATVLLAAAATCAGCAYHPPPAPPLGPVDWVVDRAALPEAALRVVEVGQCRAKQRLAVEGGGEDPVDLPIHVGVLEHPTEGLVLIDAGYGRRTAADPFDYPGRDSVRLLQLTMGRPVADRLGEIGRSADEVRHVVVTHMHSDHVGGVEDFPRAALWAARAEWEAADRKRPLKGYDPLPYRDRAVVKTVDFLGTPAYGPFASHVDLFGDRTLILLPTPGHTPGHSSVLVNLRGGSVLFTGDAAWIDANWTIPAAKSALVRTVLEDDWKRGMDALWRIRAWAGQFPELLVVAGHEAANRARLKPWPEAYR